MAKSIRRSIDWKAVGWICRTCWQTGSSTVRSIAESQHADLVKSDGPRCYRPAVSKYHRPDIVLRDEMSKVQFEGLIGEKRDLDLDAAPPIVFE